MSFPGPLRRWLASWLVFALLFTQLATAAYACPKQSESEVLMPCAEMMAMPSASMQDMEQPGLCMQHCQPTSQTIDPGHAPAISLPAIITMVVVSAQDEPQLVLSWRGEQNPAHAQAPPPPISVLHCCFRI